ncbi:MAG: tRNA (adenosine(37)-N6)-threonylcarbamoyltransferase complex ATPase subunit type 1 TsaE [Betaproteobacteria bacterium HGW-Betaproteobacteria-22]|nr:MAG: tRNA (adenosine(37)-N6)-threonylcarbamoyltransferase complex ATPase subunit type 1 TsaE [Betaproteobacteria bacterium HGW-Betaproteobacteria-22]
MDKDFTLDLTDEAATLALGAHLATCMMPNLTIYLHGDLGAGKTTLVRGLLHGLGFVGKVKSPTYTIVEPYEIIRDGEPLFNLYHFDLYRFNDEEEWESAGFRDYFNAGSVCLIEWPEKAAHILPIPDIDIQLALNEPGRRVTITGHSAHAEKCLQKFNANLFKVTQ